MSVLTNKQEDAINSIMDNLLDAATESLDADDPKLGGNYDQANAFLEKLKARVNKLTPNHVLLGRE